VTAKAGGKIDSAAQASLSIRRLAATAKHSITARIRRAKGNHPQ
jgi:hypothetical protein